MWITLDDQGPLHEQIYRALRDAILTGRAHTGERLPSTRSLAQEYGVSRNTVLAAYEQLSAEGYAESRSGSGTYVRDGLHGAPNQTRRASTGDTEPTARLSAAGRRLLAAVGGRGAYWNLPLPLLPYDFRYGDPAYAGLPVGTWARIIGRRVRGLSVRQLAYPPPAGLPELREALAAYLYRARGVVCTPEQIVIVHGSQQAVDLTVRLFTDPGDEVAVEEPHYFGFAWALKAAGARLRAIRVDADGLDVRALKRERGLRLVFVTPSHQFPMGVVLTLQRRLELLAWARRSGAHILEDDYDGEFRYDVKPTPCLQSLDRTGRVIYTGTASKLLFPGVRCGWIVAPLHLAGAFASAKALTDTGSAPLEQLALAEFIAAGHLERHVRRARNRYASLRDVLLGALESELGERVSVSGASAGLHVLVRLHDLSEGQVRPLRADCRKRGVGIYPTDHLYSKPPNRAEILLGYTCLRPADIREGVRRLRQALDALSRR
jgi:GntR family transcriptional regulator/MocR family aminotransferase